MSVISVVLAAVVVAVAAFQMGRNLKARRVEVKASELAPGTMRGQATLEWVIIGGVLVVIVAALLLTVFKPALDSAITAIFNIINTSIGGGSGS